MAALKWVKIVTDLFENPKIYAIESKKNSDKIIVIWMKTLCFAGKCNNGGILSLDGRIPFTIPMLAAAFHRDEKTIKMAYDVFLEYAMIEMINGFICVCNWEKHQASDKIDMINKRHAADQRNYRERQKGKTVISQTDIALSHGDAHGDAHVIAADIRSKSKTELEEKEEGALGKKKSTPPPTTSNHLSPFFQDIKNAWNEIAEIPSITSFNDQRKNAIDEILNTYTMDDILDAIGNVKHSKFLRGLKTGREGEQPFVISFDWFLKNFMKVHEGNYNDAIGPGRPLSDQDLSLFGGK
jgi:predicted phage replisome organizer